MGRKSIVVNRLTTKDRFRAVSYLQANKERFRTENASMESVIEALSNELGGKKITAQNLNSLLAVGDIDLQFERKPGKAFMVQLFERTDNLQEQVNYLRALVINLYQQTNTKLPEQSPPPQIVQGMGAMSGINRVEFPVSAR